MKIPLIDENQLAKRGWIEFTCDPSTNILTLANTLGRPVQSRINNDLVDRLVPIKQKNAHPKSLSAIYGTGEFPFHTDCAYMHIPPRYTLLRLSEGYSDRATLLVDSYSLPFSVEERQIMLRDVWFIKGGHRKFLSTILNINLVPNSTIMRYDPGCMRPANPTFSHSADILNLYCSQATPTQIIWNVGKVLILDNWRILHARGSSLLGDTEHRILERVLIS